MKKRLLIFTDTTKDQVNGVNRSIENLKKHLPENISLHLISTDDFISVPVLGYKEIRLSLSFPHQIGKKIDEIRPDYIHLETEGPIGLAAATICKKRNIAYTSSFHTKFPEYLHLRNRFIKKKYVHKYLQHIHDASRAIFISHRGMVPYIERHEYGKYAIVPLGIDHKQFSPGPKTLFLRENRPKLLFVGRIAIEKNIEDFLKISDEKYAKYIVWDGPDREKLEKKYPGTYFLGIKKWDDLTAIYRSVDVFVFPSKTDTLGLVNIEAMACGKSVIAYDIENTRWIITNGYNGILVKEKDFLENGIEKALKIPEKNCTESAKQFSWENYREKFLKNQVQISPQIWI